MDTNNNNLQSNIQIKLPKMETFSQATKRVIRETVNSEVIVAVICTLAMIVLFGTNL